MERNFYGLRREDPLGLESPTPEIPPEEITEEAIVKEALTPQRVIGEKEVNEAAALLMKYKQGKANLESRIKEDELWWELRHWEAIRKKREQDLTPKPTSAWLVNTIISKHADAMDNFPEPVVLPRERSDEASADTLTEVLPVVMEYNDFEDTYRDQWWEKLKHGTGVYGVFWDSKKDNGLGDITVKGIDLMKIFWEPGITNIQDSRNLFIVDLVDTDLLDQMYPEHKGKLKGGNIDITEYNYDDDVDTSDKSVVVDWYYKVTDASGRTVLHYCKFCNKEVLYASENDPEYAERGYYDHGEYPVVFDTLYPEKGTPVGFGIIALDKDPQIYIDQLDANILESSMINTKKRFFVSESAGMNEDEFKDWSKPFVHVTGEVSESRIQEIVTQPLSPTYVSVMDRKVNELKETSGNRDVNNGSSSAGITAASAIAALQEAGNKVSRDSISASYKAYKDICDLVIELMRQFYDVSRAFRVTMPNDQYKFIEMNNSQIGLQPAGVGMNGEVLYRKPIFDVRAKAVKRSPFSLMESNQRAQELYAMGFFNPQRAQESLTALDMMEFEGIDKVRDKVQEGETLYNQLQQMMQLIQRLTGIAPDGQQGGPAMPQGNPGGGHSIQATNVEARKPMTSYGQRLAERSKPDIAKPEGQQTGAR